MGLFRKSSWTVEQLIDGCRSNDRQAQELFYKRFYDIGLRIVRRYTKDDETQLHIINEGFLRIFQKIDSYSSTGSLEGWISKIMFHEVSNFYRKKSNQYRFIELEDYRGQLTENEAGSSAGLSRFRV